MMINFIPIALVHDTIILLMGIKDNFDKSVVPDRYRPYFDRIFGSAQNSIFILFWFPKFPFCTRQTCHKKSASPVLKWIGPHIPAGV